MPVCDPKDSSIGNASDGDMAPTATSGRYDNFDALRLFAAVAVLLSHSVPITYGDNRYEILYRISGGQTTVGELAVVVFFAMSG